MTANTQDLQVRHNPDKSRFEVQLGDQVGVSQYRKHKGIYIFTHTEVPDEYEGQGIGGRLVKFALETVKAEGAKVLPMCPFVKAYIRRHPEYQPLVVPMPAE